MEVEDDIEWRRRMGDKAIGDVVISPKTYKPISVDNIGVNPVEEYMKVYNDSYSSGTWDVDKSSMVPYIHPADMVTLQESNDKFAIQDLADTCEKLVVKSDKFADIVKAMGVKVYRFNNINFVKQSDLDNLEDMV